MYLISIAPEVIRNKLEYSKLCDVWSMGVIMYALLCGSMPFKGETASQLEDQIMSGELGFKEVEWITISDGAKELIKGMLNVSTVHRLTARKVLEDPWITGEARKRIDPLMMLMDDSPPTNSAAKTIVDTKSSLTTTEQTKLSPEPLRPPSRSKSMSQSTSTGKVHASSRNRYSGGSPTPRKPVSSSISTGRIQSTSISSKPTVNQRSTTTRKISNSNK
jgi:serine/threonine protein kinase